MNKINTKTKKQNDFYYGINPHLGLAKYLINLPTFTGKQET